MCRIAVRGFSASNWRSARRLNAIAALRANTMQAMMPRTSCQRHETAGVSRADNVQAMTADNSANGSANTVWLKRIISRIIRNRCMLARSLEIV